MSAFIKALPSFLFRPPFCLARYDNRLDWLQRKVMSKGFVFCCKRIAYLYHETEFWGSYVDWYGVADWFEARFWRAMRRSVPQ
jgi:hypothetical protein